MEIRMAYPNEIKRIMEIIQDAKESLAQRQVDQWQDGYPDEEIIFEDILESRGYVAVEDQEVVAYAAVHKGNEAAYNEIYDGKWEHDNYMYVTFHRVAVAKEAAGKGVAQTFLQGLIEGEKGPDFRCDTHPDNLVMQHCLKNWATIIVGRSLLMESVWLIKRSNEKQKPVYSKWSQKRTAGTKEQKRPTMILYLKQFYESL